MKVRDSCPGDTLRSPSEEIQEGIQTPSPEWPRDACRAAFLAVLPFDDPSLFA